MKEWIVQYYCDQSGDHTAEIADCLSQGKKVFTDKQKMLKFVDQCSHVINLDELFDVAPEGRKQTLEKSFFEDSNGF